MILTTFKVVRGVSNVDFSELLTIAFTVANMYPSLHKMGNRVSREQIQGCIYPFLV